MALRALQESYSLSVLLYASPALSLTCKQISELNLCWNGVVRRIFGYHNWESVRHSSKETPPRSLFAPNDPYLGTLGGQPSLPWSPL